MKFAIVVVMLALAVGAQSSILAAAPWGVWGAGVHGGPWGGPYVGPWTHGHAAVDIAGHGPWGHAAVDIAGHGPWGHAAVDHGVHGAWGHGAWGGYPGIGLSQGPDHHGHGVYVAKTRGAIHTAPLAGHINSATSVNVAPAPGTH